MWPAQLGIGVHNLTEMLEAAYIGRDIGALTLDDTEVRLSGCGRVCLSCRLANSDCQGLLDADGYRGKDSHLRNVYS
jgi:hypothetical protein